MKILFVHPQFPGPFRFLAPALAADPANTVMALTARADLPTQWQGVEVVAYTRGRSNAGYMHPWLQEFESQTIRGEAAAQVALQLQAQGFTPDVIVAYPGWGESLFLQEVWPQARLAVFAQAWQSAATADATFDAEFAQTANALDGARLRLHSLNQRLHADMAAAAWAPTQWQADTYPAALQNKITVVPEGIDTAAFAPNPQISLTLNGSLRLGRGDEVVTFGSPTLEPCRGYHVFMRSLPELLRLRPQAQVLIMGGTEGGQGVRPPAGQSWRELFAAEVRPQISDADWARVHFLGAVQPPTLLAVLQLSAVHVHLGYPHVQATGLPHAMSVGCAIVGSDTAPVRECLQQGVTGRLVDFGNAPALAGEVARLLADPAERARLGQAAREWACAHHDHAVCLPRQLQWVSALAEPQSHADHEPESTAPEAPLVSAADIADWRQSLHEVQTLLQGDNTP